MAKKKSSDPVKETCRLIRVSLIHRKAHRNKMCRVSRTQALEVYDTLTKEQKAKIPDKLRVRLRYRSEKYFGNQNDS